MKPLLLFSAFILSLNNLNAQFNQLIWSDEFNTNTVDSSKWNIITGLGCDEHMCAFGVNAFNVGMKKNNVTINNGILSITVKEEAYTAQYAVDYTSGYIHTMNKFSVKYGRVEARMKLPEGKGLWPAFWMMPVMSKDGVWPKSGEIDIMEMRGRLPDRILGTIHYGNYWPNNLYTSNDYILNSGKLTDDYHIYAIEWNADKIDWYVDNTLYANCNKNTNQYWTFNSDFYIILDLLVGGDLDVEPDETTVFPSSLDIDYVRVYSTPELFTITGEDDIFQNKSNLTYSVAYNAANTYNWILPEGVANATPLDSNKITVNWGTKSGILKVEITTNGQTKTISYNVDAHEDECDFIFTDFDQNTNILLSSGIHNQVANTLTNTQNSSPNIGKVSTAMDWYQYEALNFNNIIIEDALDYENQTRVFLLDVYTNMPIGTPIAIILENVNLTGIPNTSRSRFIAYTTKQNEWETLSFDVASINTNAPSVNINQIKMIFGYNVAHSYNYISYYDNFRRKNFSISDCIDDTGEEMIQIANKISVFPSPVTDLLYFDLGKEEDAVITIKTIQGQVIIPSTNINNNNYLNLSNFSNGVYIVSINIGKQIIYKKVIKQ